MKKIYMFLGFVLLSIYCFAGNESLFSIDEDQLNNEFSSLNKLEQFLVENKVNSMNELSINEFLTKEGININMMHVNAASDLDFQWEGFLWGFLCCPVGFFVVAINEEKTRDDKISYWIGVAAGSIIGAITSAQVYYVF